MMEDGINALHSVSFPRKYLDDKFLVRCSPSAHLGICVNGEPDVFCDILGLSSLAVKGMEWSAKGTRTALVCNVLMLAAVAKPKQASRFATVKTDYP